jgi:hypothetical protein
MHYLLGIVKLFAYCTNTKQLEISLDKLALISNWPKYEYDLLRTKRFKPLK